MTVLPHVGGTRSPKAETRRLMKTPESEAKRLAAIREAMAKKRRTDHAEVVARWAMGESMRSIARSYGVSHNVIARIVKAYPGSARSPQQSPPAATTPLVANGVAVATHPSDEAGGLRGAPATTNGHPGAASNGSRLTRVGTGDNERPAKAAGAPIVRRQLDAEGDCLYIVELPATTRYQTHARSMVDALLGPFDPGRVVWINEED